MARVATGKGLEGKSRKAHRTTGRRPRRDLGIVRAPGGHRLAPIRCDARGSAPPRTTTQVGIGCGFIVDARRAEAPGSPAEVRIGRDGIRYAGGHRAEAPRSTAEVRIGRHRIRCAGRHRAEAPWSPAEVGIGRDGFRYAGRHRAEAPWSPAEVRIGCGFVVNARRPQAPGSPAEVGVCRDGIRYAGIHRPEASGPPAEVRVGRDRIGDHSEHATPPRPAAEVGRRIRARRHDRLIGLGHPPAQAA